MKKKLFITLLFVALITMLSACGGANNESKNDGMSEDAEKNVNKTDFPIVDEEISLNIFTAKSDASAETDWNDGLPMWQEYEDMTNIKLEWSDQVLGENLAEKRNLALAGGNLPDAFFASEISNADLFKYGDQGVFIRLNDLIDDYAPNLKALMEEDPNIEKGMTFPDGNIYSMPGLRDNDFLSIRIGARPWIDTEWLDRLEMDMPETTDEFYEFLTAVKEADEDVIPYSGVNMGNLIGWIKGAYGLNNTGADNFDLDPETNDLRFLATTDEYREMVEYVHKLYDEKLIDPSIFTIEWDQFMANAQEGKYASTVFYNPKLTFRGDNFDSASALEGPHGDKMYSQVLPPLFNNGQFAITNENPNPAATVRWMDYFYGDEGARLIYMGIEGESYIEEDGEFRYLDEIEDAEHRDGEISKFVPWVGINPPGLVTNKYFSGTEASEESMEAADKIEPYVPEELWSKFTYSQEENKLLNSVGADIEKYMVEMRDKFISGDESLDDASWDHYVETIEEMGLDDYMEVQKDAYDRYME